MQKLNGTFKTPVIETKHTIGNISKSVADIPIHTTSTKPSVDPYRELPE